MSGPRDGPETRAEGRPGWKGGVLTAKPASATAPKRLAVGTHLACLPARRVNDLSSCPAGPAQNKAVLCFATYGSKYSTSGTLPAAGFVGTCLTFDADALHLPQSRWPFLAPALCVSGGLCHVVTLSPVSPRPSMAPSFPLPPRGVASVFACARQSQTAAASEAGSGPASFHRDGTEGVVELDLNASGNHLAWRTQSTGQYGDKVQYPCRVHSAFQHTTHRLHAMNE